MARALVIFGRVPLFFYVVHLPFIHLLTMAYSQARYGFIGPEGSPGGRIVGWYLQGQQYAPDGYEQNLWLVWGVWIAWVIPQAVIWRFVFVFSGPCRRRLVG